MIDPRKRGSVRNSGRSWLVGKPEITQFFPLSEMPVIQSEPETKGDIVCSTPR
jgi:hypothetical protein